MTYFTRRERIEAERAVKQAAIRRRRKTVTTGLVGVAAVTGATFTGMSSATAALDNAPADSHGQAPTTATPTTSSGAETYTIEAGDTLSQIAAELDVSLNELLEANDLSASTTIYPGQELILPGTGVTEASAEHADTEPVTGGDGQPGLADPDTSEEPLQVQPASATSQASGWQGQAVNEAINIVNSGASYSFGANGPSAYDCSALVKAAYASAGKDLPRTSSAQYAAASQYVSLDNLQPGDLIFWSNNGSGSGIYHVAIYIGDGQIAQARNPSSGITIDNLSTYQQYNPPLQTAARF
ncbi:NlpC/P60 family protein [Auritidibacter ignavus]|uniref:C40 family peptidase n=1 Tax=Auritidibacter ignavus TaxID=678932 RepID=UPI0024487D42|nr:C40 family peptidase [Auritidibacter ignavus]WGH89972.1 NlpC/P60 family protein [Auritidibacter ignavus]